MIIRDIHWRLPLCALLLATSSPPLLAQTELTPPPEQARTVAPEQWLLQQLRLGEARHDKVLVEQALERLEVTAPNDPQVLEARVRKAVRENDLDQARELVQRLEDEAPQSDAYRMARLNLALASGKESNALSQARLLATTGRVEKAKQAYDDLLGGDLPTLPLALEYWQLVARLPEGTPRALEELEALDKRYPRSPELNFALSRLLFDVGRDDEAYARLEQLAKDTHSRKAAARQWRDALREKQPSQASVAGWQRFLETFDNSEYAQEARDTLERQRQLLANPAYQAKRRGLARQEQSGGSAGEADIQRALRTYPEDVELLGALGVIRLRQGRHDDALALLRRARELDDSPYTGDKWRNLIATTTYWQQINRGDEALAAGDDQAALDAYVRARKQIAKASEAWIGIGDVARFREAPGDAERSYRQALRLDSSSTTALERLAELYAEQSYDKAMAFIDDQPPARREALAPTRQRLQVAKLKEEGESLADKQRWSAAAARFEQARQLAPENVWLTYSLANALAEDGRRNEADRAFQTLFSQLSSPQEQAQGRYAQALYLAGTDRDALALDALRRVPDAQRNAATRSLQARLERGQLLARAERQRAGGDEAAAIATLEQGPEHTDISRRLGDWALSRGELDEAQSRYQRALDLDADNTDAQLGLVDAALARGDRAAARRRLEALEPAAEDFNARRRQANAWAALGEPTRARQTMDALLAEEKEAADPLTLRDAGRIAAARGDADQALERYRQALVAAEPGGVDTLEDDAAFTRRLRTREDDGWLASSLRSDAAEAYQAQNTRVRYGHQREEESGTSGVSELTADIDMLAIDTPLAGGRGLVRIDRVRLDAGRLDRDADGLNRDTFGTCAVAGCAGDTDQQQTGVSLGFGWYNDTWQVDVGTTPLGFEVIDVVGGVQYNGDLGPLWFDAAVSRRALDDSLLAYAGVEDPRTGTTWGGVRASGLTLGLGYDQGGPWGVWSKFGAHYLGGKNVEDNSRVQAMGGVYRKLINRPHERLSIGINTLYMHYDKELGGYTLGQGGYYSPQQYFSLSLPISYARRTANWSWELGASVSNSWSDSDDSPRYPLGGGASLADAGAMRTGGSGGDVGYGLNGQVERRLGDHWSLGLGFMLQEAEDYSPNLFNLTLRYDFNAWQGDLELPPKALVPYSDFD